MCFVAADYVWRQNYLQMCVVAAAAGIVVDALVVFVVVVVAAVVDYLAEVVMVRSRCVRKIRGTTLTVYLLSSTLLQEGGADSNLWHLWY